MYLNHYDDGKNNFESHEVYIEQRYAVRVEFDDIIGYGATVEEATEDYKTKFLEFYKDICEVKKRLEEDSIPFIEVDAFGNPFSGW